VRRVAQEFNVAGVSLRLAAFAVGDHSVDVGFGKGKFDHSGTS